MNANLRACITYTKGELSLYKSKFILLSNNSRTQFRKNAGVRDIRVIDMLVVQGQQDLKEVVEHWKQTCHIMAKWFPEENIAEKPKDFISKFLSGQE